MVLAPGGATLIASTASASVGLGSGMIAAALRDPRQQVAEPAPALARGDEDPPLEITSSTGASARDDRIEPAMMMPAVACWLITSQAPTASTADCTAMRSARESPPMPPVTSAERWWAPRYWRPYRSTGR